MWNWLHHIITPHCEQCEYDKHYVQEKLSLLLEQERAEKFRLLQLLAPSLDTSARSSDPVDINSLRRNPKSLMKELEHNSFLEAERIRKRNSEERISEIEKEANIG